MRAPDRVSLNQAARLEGIERKLKREAKAGARVTSIDMLWRNIIASSSSVDTPVGLRRLLRVGAGLQFKEKKERRRTGWFE